MLKAEQIQKIEQLYLERYTLLATYAWSTLEDEPLAEAATQETFRIACEKADELLASPHPEGWLVMTLKNIIQSIQRNSISAGVES